MDEEIMIDEGLRRKFYDMELNQQIELHNESLGFFGRIYERFFGDNNFRSQLEEELKKKWQL